MQSLIDKNAAGPNRGLLQRKCASCSTHTIASDKCEECKNENGILQRKSMNNSEFGAPPQIVHEVLNSPGQPLDAGTRSFFETRFAHNFSSVPISSTSPQVSTSSLTVGEPDDVYEQEADRIADSVIHKAGKEPGSLSLNDQQDSKVDLGNVRLHTDSRGAESARSLNALAYTFGNDIVFGAGQFAPATDEGRKLLAHELTHVAQQSHSSGKIRRKVKYLKPDIVETDPVKTVLDNPNLALTTPKINGQLLPDPVVKNKALDFSAAGKIIQPLFSQLYVEHKEGKSTCKVREPEVEVSARISILKKPESKVWQGSVPGTKFKDRSKACEGAGEVTVYIKGKSGSDAIKVYEKVMANEMEHVDDLNKTAKKHFEPYIDFLNKFSSVPTDQKTEIEQCQKAYAAYISKKVAGKKDVAFRDEEMINAFLTELTQLVKTRDKKGGSHDFKPDVQIDGKDCFRVNVKV